MTAYSFELSAAYGFELSWAEWKSTKEYSLDRKSTKFYIAMNLNRFSLTINGKRGYHSKLSLLVSLGTTEIKMI